MYIIIFLPAFDFHVIFANSRQYEDQYLPILLIDEMSFRTKDLLVSSSLLFYLLRTRVRLGTGFLRTQTVTTRTWTRTQSPGLEFELLTWFPSL